jgi:O-antigen ligase
VALVLEVTGVIPSWYQIIGGPFVDLAEFDRSWHWVTLAVALGMDGRWGGFMLDPNALGPIGAFLVVYGFARSGWPRVVFVVSGLLVVVLADSRVTYAAVALGLLILLLLPGWGVPLLRVTAGKAAAAVVGLLMGVRLFVDLVTNPAETVSMTGRADMWPDFLSLWDTAPWFGVGTRAITQAVIAGVLPEWAVNGHNQYVDTLVRYGVVGLLLSSLVLLILAALAVRGGRRGRGLGAALIATLLLVMVSNLVLDWRYPSVPFAMLLVTALVSATVPRREVGSSPSP